MQVREHEHKLRWARVLAVVALLYLLVQLVAFDETRFLTWDEAQYLAEVEPGRQQDFFSSHRARGIVVLIAPPALAGVGVPGVRIYLAVVSSVLLFVAYRTWVTGLSAAAVLGAALFASGWMTLLYGNEIMPNLFAAFASVAAAGELVAGRAAQWPRRHLLGLAVAIAVVTLFRPIDGVAAGLGVSLSAVAIGGWSGRRPIAASIAGGAAGVVPWIVEAFVRFGGPLDRLRNAAEVTQVSGKNMFLQHLALTDGPAVGPDVPAAIPLGGALWWLTLLTATAWALWRLRGHDRHPAVVTAAVTGLVLATPYLAVAGALAPRFLLPAYGLLSLSAAAGLLAVAAPRSQRHRLGSIAVTAVVVVWIAWGVSWVERYEATDIEKRNKAKVVGEALSSAAAGRSCSFATPEARPQLVYVSGCRGVLADVLGRRVPSLPPAEAQFVLTTSPLPEQSPIREWDVARVPGVPRWRIFHRPPD